MPSLTDSAALIIPAFPSFSPAAIADLLNASRQAVYYWMTSGKLAFFRDNIDEPYVTREELVRFAKEYLRRSIA